MPVNGVRVLPNMPSNVPHLQTLIREFETTFNDWSSHRSSGSESSASSGGSFVKKIVQAYEMNMKTSLENVQRNRVEKENDLFNNLEIIRNWKNAEKSDSSPTGCEFSNLPASNNLKMKSTIFSVQSVAENDFVAPNQHCSNSNDSTALKTRSAVFSKINMYGPESELPNIPSRKKKIGQFFCSSLKNEVEDKSKSNGSMTFSSFLEDEDKDEDPLDNILTNSRDSSGINDNSYRNLQIDLYNFEDKKWEHELSSSSLPSLKSSSKSSHDDVLSTSTDSYSQTITMTRSMDVSRDSENFQNMESETMQSCFKLESPCKIGASLKRPIKIDNSVCVTWASAISERLSQKKSLKKLLSAINSRLSLNCKKIIGKSRGKQRKEQQHVVDSGFAEQFPSPLSFLPQKSSDHDEKLSTTPTFGTFGHAKTTSECRASSRRTADNPRIVLTEVSHGELTLTDDPELSDPISWVSIRSTPSSSRKHVDLSSKNASFSKLKASCEHPLIPKHPHLSQSKIPKHPFVAQTKMDQMEKGGTAAKEEEVKLRTNMELRLDEQELRSMSSTLLSIPALNISYVHPRTCEWVASSPKSSYDLLSAQSCNSTFDEIALHQESLVYDVPKQVFNLTTDSTSSVQLHERSEPRAPRYATVNSKNLRFSMSREKLRAIERSFDA
ncbi:uncharacterized protein [Linepithema humile]|uniref:uncharacterized protein n=1 Tax=Linepithema humile TaxID=83485 RepID=UPI00062363A6|nr:PREDICTED: uncharacterized protein LOC105675789 [Linepithema humile]XP_012228623.1 PREDICTED: uncharacterized protein LOC105675789 [Linepithema humile]